MHDSLAKTAKGVFGAVSGKVRKLCRVFGVESTWLEFNSMGKFV